LVAVLVLVAVVVIGADFIFGAIAGGGGSSSGSAPSAAAAMPTGVVVQGKGGHWTNVTPDGLAAMLTRKDFTLLNVKTPYIGEIDGTDLYIPYAPPHCRRTRRPASWSTAAAAPRARWPRRRSWISGTRTCGTSTAG
jgi:hypothetical protein